MKNFLIVGTQRTGSSALAEFVGLHPMVTCGWEWTLQVPWRRKLEVAEQALAGNFSFLIQKHQDHMANVFDSRKIWLGFRCLFRSSNKWIIHPRFSPALWLDRLEDHLCWLASQPDVHIIHIVRRQGLDWLKSVYVSRKANVYVGRTYPKGIKVRIPLREAVARLRAKDWVDYRLSTLANSNYYLQLNYEDFLADQNTVTALALQFLKCDPAIMRIGDRRLHKQSEGSVADYVLNYNELFEELERLDLLTSRFDRL